MEIQNSIRFLSIRDLSQLETGKFMHKLKYKLLPTNFSHYLNLIIQFIPSQLKIRKLFIADIIQKIQLNNLLCAVM